jgi:hydroxypyruvate isomerase
MGRIRQSFCYGLYQGDLPLAELCRRAAGIGFAAVELWDWRNAPFAELAEGAAGAGLVVASLSGHRSLPDGLNRWENHDRIEAELRESIDLCQRHGIPGMICFAGNRVEGRTEREEIDAVVAGLNRVKTAAETAGVNLNLEYLNSRVDHPGYLFDRMAIGLEVVERCASPNVKILYDIYHAQIMEGDLIRTIRAHHHAIGHFHTAGNPGRHELDENQEIHYPAVMRAIADTGYHLYVGHEFGPTGDRLAALEAAFRVCDVG